MTLPFDPSIIDDICRRYGIVRLRVFGSYARGDQQPSSDLDLIADLSRPIGLIDFVGAQQELSERSGVRVDLLTEDGLSRYLRERILREARVVYERAA